jgi:hypothetical protein
MPEANVPGPGSGGRNWSGPSRIWLRSAAFVPDEEALIGGISEDSAGS